MNFTLRQLEVFAACANYLHFTQAANALNMTPPAVNKQIANLEVVLGVALFKVIGKKVFLTPHGEMFAQKVRHVVGEFKSLQQWTCKELLQLPTAIRVSLSPGLANIVYPLTSEYKKNMPQQPFEFISHSSLEAIKQALIENQIDITFIGSKLSTKLFSQIKLFDLPFYEVMHEDFPLAKDSLMLMPSFEKRWIPPHAAVFYFDSYADVKEAVLAKMGRGILPANLVGQTPGLMKITGAPVGIKTVYGTVLKANHDKAVTQFRRFLQAANLPYLSN